MLLVVVLLGAFVLTDGPRGRAQPGPDQLQSLSPSMQAKGGIELLQTGRLEAALPLLEAAVAADSARTVPDHGAVAYWLGEAYAQRGDSARAHRTWRQGLRRLTDLDRFDVRLADAYLRSLTTNRLRGERLWAGRVYLDLLGRVRPDTSAALDSLFRRRVAQLVPLMSDDVFSQVVEGDRSEKPETWSIRSGAGDRLRAWWRGLDPFPATPENERIEEHVTRLVHAQQSFSCPDRTRALDDRGTTYLRFGAPYKRSPLRYQDTDFFKEVFRFGVPIPPSGFPDSEMWLYSQIHESGQFLFAEDGESECFELARANDLLPSTLKMTRSDNERGLNIAYSSLMALRSIYRELALYHITYSGRYSEIANYADYQEMQAAAAKMGAPSPAGEQQTTVGSGIGQTRTVTSNPAFGIASPTRFVSRMISRAEREDKAAAERRAENMPNQYTALYDDTPQLPVAVRTARFLNEDGTTRTEVYWGVSAEAARLPADAGESPPPSLIRFTAARQNRDRSVTDRMNRRYRLAADPTEQRQVFAPPAVTFEGTSAPHHLRLQWTQYRFWQNDDGSTAGLGPKYRFTTARADSLSPLRTAGPPPEMSDLKVLSLPDTTAATLANPTDQATPYPFRTITADLPLLLAFEVYHLTYGADDRTRYTVSYEIEGETRRGVSRLLRGQDTQRTETTTTRQGSSRRAEEFILLDLSEIERDEEQTVEVRVEVTDEVTGASVSRTLDFVLRPPSS